jgi:hypothetical protein
MSPSPLMKPWPGRNDTPQRREDELELVLLELCLVVRASQSHPSLTPRRQYFLQRTVLGVRFLVKLEALSLLFYPFPGGHKLSLLHDLHPCASSTSRHVNCRLCRNLVDCRFFAN